MARILLIDDDADFSGFLREQLDGLGHEVCCQDRAEDALRRLSARERFDVVLLDNKMPSMSGVELLAVLKERDIRVSVILMTNAHSDQTVFEVMKYPGTNYVIKPLEFDSIMEELLPAIDEALELGSAPRPVLLSEVPEVQSPDASTIVGRSKAVLNVLKQIGRLSNLDETVLILGETGTGKDLVARAIHTNSKRRDRRFVPMNCTAMNENLLDDDLFGHEAGAFTGAEKLRKGRFEHADGGTLFLDEIGDMPLVLQAKLLRVLENNEVVRVGSNEPIEVNVRVLAATHRDLQAMVREGTFRQDLYYRLEGMTIVLPSLRERREDIELLTRHFLGRLLDEGGSNFIHPKAMELLREYHWPGNIRQLKKTLARAVQSCRGSRIMPEDLQFGETAQEETREPAASGDSLPEALRRIIKIAWDSGRGDLWPWLQQQLECELIRFGLEQTVPKLSQVQLAKRLGIARNTLRARIEQHQLQAPDSGGE